jgi:hypothetical protein
VIPYKFLVWSSEELAEGEKTLVCIETQYKAECAKWKSLIIAL